MSKHTRDIIESLIRNYKLDKCATCRGKIHYIATFSSTGVPMWAICEVCSAYIAGNTKPLRRMVSKCYCPIPEPRMIYKNFSKMYVCDICGFIISPSVL